MAQMTHEYSKFPAAYYEPNRFRDADDSIGYIINAIKDAQVSGNYVQAQRLIEQNKDRIKPYLLSTETINAIEEETRNLEIYARQNKQQIFYQDDEPDTESINDVWIG